MSGYNSRRRSIVSLSFEGLSEVERSGWSRVFLRSISVYAGSRAVAANTVARMEMHQHHTHRERERSRKRGIKYLHLDCSLL